MVHHSQVAFVLIALVDSPIFTNQAVRIATLVVVTLQVLDLRLPYEDLNLMLQII